MTFIQLISKDGLPFTVNKYFLQLYDEFFYNLIEGHLNNDIVIYFPDESNETLERLINSINWKHLSCSSQRQVPSISIKTEDLVPKETKKSKDNFDNNNYENEMPKADLEPPKADKKDKLDYFKDEKENNIKTPAIENPEWKDGGNLQCPYDDDLYSTVLPDEMYAHISINHRADKTVRGRPKSTEFPKIHFFLKKLKKRISNKCFLCKNSDFEYKNRGKLLEHYQKCHAAVREYETCSHCDRKMLKTSLKNHLKYLNAEEISCETCGKMFKRIDHLNRHARLVHDKTPFECPVCAKVFFWNEKEKERLLNEHTQAVHIGFKPFVCEICGKKMSKYSNLDDHRQKVHNAQKLSIGAYREMVESGNYKYLIEVPTNLDYKGAALSSKTW